MSFVVLSPDKKPMAFWAKVEDHPSFRRCSNCQHQIRKSQYKTGWPEHCPKCGILMDIKAKKQKQVSQ